MLAGVCILCAALAAVLLVWPELRSISQTVSGEETSVAGVGGMLGEVGRVVADREGEIWVEVRGERWKATAAVPLVQGDRIRVLSVNDLQLAVEPASHEAAPAPAVSGWASSRIAGLALWALASALAPIAIAASPLWIWLGVPLGSITLLVVLSGAGSLDL